MYIKRNYGFWMTLRWSSKPLYYGVLYGLAVCTLSYFIEFTLSIPWSPITVLGIAVAFYLGFKNNSSYDRTWEARKIWGSIVNNSRTFGAAIVSFIQMNSNAEGVKKELIYRHIAWLTALRYQLRTHKSWEHPVETMRGVRAPEAEEHSREAAMEKELCKFLSREEYEKVIKHSNVATQLLKTQSIRLQELRNEGAYDDFRHMQFHELIGAFYTDQGKSERIKNFPFPRQYASTALWITLVFCFFVPFAMLDIFGDHGLRTFILCPLLSGLICWMFMLMEKIGDYSENPFEGTYNDVPITNISRTIEIDIREMIDDSDIPGPVKEKDGFLM